LTRLLNGILEVFYSRIFKLENNVGLGNALRIGIENCTYEYIARMDTDDYNKTDEMKLFDNRTNLI